MAEVIDFDIEKIIDFTRASSRKNGPLLTTKRQKTNHLLAIGSLEFQDINETLKSNQFILPPSLPATEPSSPFQNLDKGRVTIAERSISISNGFPLSEFQVSEFFSQENGFTTSATDPNLHSFESSEVKLLFASPDTPLLMVKNKTKFGLKRTELLLSMNVLNLDWRLIQREIHIARELPLNKRPENLITTGPNFKISVRREDGEANKQSMAFVEINYKVELLELVLQLNTLDLISGVHELVKANSVIIPTEYDDSLTNVNINPHDPINPQLFYSAVSENIQKLPEVDDQFDIPELETQLLRFQRKTVKWLLQKEGVEYDNSTNRCIPCALMPSELREQLLSASELDEVEENSTLDSRIHKILSKLGFGWSLIRMNQLMYWFNCYTGNISTKKNVYKMLLDFFPPSSTSSSTEELPAQGLLAEEMGLGKTVEITTLVILNQRPIDQINKPVQITLKPYGDLKTIPKSRTTLIISPESILRQWVEEIVRLAPSLAVTVYKGLDKYPKLNKNPNLIAEYLKGFDVVFTTYGTISNELEYANYSSTKKKTRSNKRTSVWMDLSNDAGIDVDGSEGEADYSNLNDNELLKKYQSLFQLSLLLKKDPVNANQKSNDNQSETDYEKALQDEIQLAIKHNQGLPDNYKSNHLRDYQTPLMLMQFWRVVLDEVQMVSSSVSRAFQSAALIPKHHSWGVSGTPIKKNFDDLLSILKFLKFQPFGRDYYSKMTWQMLTNTNKRSNIHGGNQDFIKLWSQIALRHTKAMVHDDIKLPPQKRVLMSIPFNPVEQENYNQMLEGCLATICLDQYGNPVVDDWEPSSSILAHMRFWLVKLRQVCCNPQVGNLNISSRRYKSRNHLFYGKSGQGLAIQQLKTLENVLDDMIDRAHEQITDIEKEKVQLYLDLAEYEDYLLMPDEALLTLNAGVWNTERIVFRLTKYLEKLISEYKTALRTHSTNNPEETKSVGDHLDLDNDSDEDSEKVSTVNGKRAKPGHLVKYEEKINATRIKLRGWNVTLHKFYFLMGSSHFQCYDEEYQKKVQGAKFSSIFEAVEGIGNMNKVDKLIDCISPLICGVSTENLKHIDSLAGFQGDLQSLKEIHQFQEQFFYDEAEKIRGKILESTIKGVSKTVKDRITSREFYFKDMTKLSDSGSRHLQKSSKKLFKCIPLIDFESLEENVLGMRAKIFFENVVSLAEQLNEQAEVLNEWMEALITMLCKPLLIHDKTPDGAEYEESIDDQDKVSCYLHVLSGLILDRSEFVLGIDSSNKSATFKKQQETFTQELGNVNNFDFLKELQDKRQQVKPKLSSSLQELALKVSGIEQELYGDEGTHKDIDVANLGSIERELFQKFSGRVRIIFENQKLAEVLIQKEVVNCNAVFNSRIEYFKQLQQISDSVRSSYNFEKEVDENAIVPTGQGYINSGRDLDVRLTKSIARYRYLQSLAKIGDGSDSSDSFEEDGLMCTICRSTITIGSLTQCGHKYCKECLEHWLTNSRTCPMCKAHISEQTVYNFTHHKPNLKVNAVHDGEGGEGTNKDGNGDLSAGDDIEDESNRTNLHSIYKSIDTNIVGSIVQIELKTSYSSKVDMIIKQVLYLKNQDPNVQIVIFSQWQDLLYIIGTALKNLNISYLASHGTFTPEMGGGRRRYQYDSVEEFKRPGSEITCFLLNARAQASGLTLINATHIFLCEPLVNTSLELQAISRIHRIGQTKETTVWMFAIENTIEESIVLMSTNKRLQYFEQKKVNPSAEVDPSSSEKDLSKAESMTMTKSGGIDTMVNKNLVEGELVTNSDLWNAFFSATAKKKPIEMLNKFN